MSDILQMAAFEAVSEVRIRTVSRETSIDFRSAMLPDNNLWQQEDESSEDYDPRAHRDPKQPIKVWMAYFNLIRAAFGAGVLGFPLAISQSGIILGPVLAVFTGGLILHTHWVLINCLNEISKRLKIPYISYRYGFRTAMLHGPPITKCIGKCAPALIGTFMLMSQIGICTVFVDFTSDSLRDICDWKSSATAMLVLVVPYMLFEFCMKTLKIVSYISMFGNILNLVGLILIFYHIFLQPHGRIINARTQALPLLFAFGTFLFNLSAVGVILTVDKALKDPTLMVKKFGILNVGLGTPIVVATVFGVLGYWSFGTMEENVLRYLPYDDKISMVAIGLYMVAVSFAYPIHCYPAIQIILEVVKNHNPIEEPSAETLALVEKISRPLFVLLTFLIAYTIPFQGPFVAFVGNICTTMLSLVFPALMEICLMYPGPYGKHKVYLIKDLLIIMVGLLAWIFGAYLCGDLIYVRIVASQSSHEVEYFR